MFSNTLEPELQFFQINFINVRIKVIILYAVALITVFIL